MTQQIDRYAVFGNPISQSKSPFIHTLFARQTNQSLTYTAELAPVDGFVAGNYARHLWERLKSKVRQNRRK